MPDLTRYDLATVTITKTLTDNGTVVSVETEALDGDALDLYEAIALIEFGKLTLLEDRMIDDEAE